MATSAIFAQGTQLKRGNAATPEVFTTVAEIVELSGPTIELETIDVTSHSSIQGWMEFIAGLADGGEMELELNFVPDGTSHIGLIQDAEARRVSNYRLVFPNTAQTTWSFTAFVSEFSPTAAVDEQLKAEVTLKVTGKPVLS